MSDMPEQRNQPARPSAADRRRERRPVSMRGYMLRDGGTSHVIELFDLNYGGCGIRTPVELTPGEIVKITVVDRGSIPAEVRWYEAGRAGLDFSPVETEREPVERSAERIPVEIEAILRGRGRPSYRVKVLDLSPTGCQVKFVERPREGDRLSIKFDFMEAIEAEVLWADSRTAGLKFENAIHPEVFGLLMKRLASE